MASVSSPLPRQRYSESIKARIVTAGRALLADALSAPGGDAPGVAVTLVKALADLRDAYAAIIESAFGDDRDFTRALKEAFETLLNDGGSGGGTGESGDDHAPSAARASRAVLCAEYLSIFVDEHMRNKFRGADEATIDATLNRVIGLFRFLHNKDVFEAYYKDHLQKRLLGACVKERVSVCEVGGTRRRMHRRRMHTLRSIVAPLFAAKSAIVCRRQVCQRRCRANHVVET